MIAQLKKTLKGGQSELTKLGLQFEETCEDNTEDNEKVNLHDAKTTCDFVVSLVSQHVPEWHFVIAASVCDLCADFLINR